MNIRKFVAASSRDALAQVKQTLGADALILSNRAVPGGVEIAAMAPHEVPAAAPLPAPRQPAPSQRQPAPSSPARDPASGHTLREPAPQAHAGAARIGAFQPPRVEPEHVVRGIPAEARDDRRARPQRPSAPQRSTAEVPARAASLAHSDAGFDGAQMASELKAVRSLLETQLASLAWTDAVRRSPLRMKFTRLLLGAGFSPALARRALAKMPDDGSEDSGWNWLAGVIARNILVVAREENLVARGGVYAIVGPTGVGKTTTTAKLAARCVVRHGAARLALLTTDGYRIGAQEQLRTYGRILGVPVHVIQDPASLADAIASLREKHLVLIDTVGMGQRDARVIEQVSMLANSGAQRILVLNATAQAETIEDVIQSFRGEGLAGCIVSKSDEALRMGAALDAVLRHRLPLHFVANGQRVPEDLHEPNAQYLAHRALKAPEPVPTFRLADDEFPLLIAPGDPPSDLLRGEAAHA